MKAIKDVVKQPSQDLDHLLVQGQNAAQKIAMLEIENEYSSIEASNNLKIEGAIGKNKDVQDTKQSEPLTGVSQFTKNPLASIITTSSNDSASSPGVYSSMNNTKRMIMRIDVSGPALREEDMMVHSNPGTANGPQGGKLSRRGGGFSQEDSSARNNSLQITNAKNEDIEKIRQQLCKSPLNSVFQDQGIKVSSRVNSRTKLNIEEGKGESNETSKANGVVVQDWRPVVCRQTQQFLHSNDSSQKSEYKHFMSNILRNKKQIIAHNQKKNISQRRKKSSPPIKSEEELNSLQLRGKVLHIKEVEFQGVPVKIESSKHNPDSKATSKVTFKEGPVLQAKVKTNPIDGKKLLLNSSSERKDIQLKYDKSVVETMHKQSSQDIQQPLTPKMADLAKNDFPQKSTFSQIHIESSVLEASSNSKRPDSQASKKMIKVPTVPNNDQLVDYLTDGSVGSLNGLSSEVKKKKRMKKMNFELPNKTFNKTTFLNDQSPTNFAPFTANSSTPPPQNQSKQRRTRNSSKHDISHIADSDKGNQNNDDLIHVVGDATRQTRLLNKSPSPIADSPSRLKGIARKDSVPSEKPARQTYEMVKPAPLNLSKANDYSESSIQPTTLRMEQIQDIKGQMMLIESRNVLSLKNRITEETSPVKSHLPSKDNILHKISQQSRYTSVKSTSPSRLQNSKVQDGTKMLSSKASPLSKQSPKVTKKNSIIIKSVQVTPNGQVFDFRKQSAELKREQALQEQKKKAIKERLQNIIEFKGTQEPLSFVQPVKLAAKTQKLNQDQIAALRVTSPLGLGSSLPNSTPSSPQELRQMAEASTSPIKLDRELSQANRSKQNRSPMMDNITSHDNTIYEEPNVDSAATATLHASDEKTKEAEMKTKPGQKPVKVRLFDIGGIKDFVQLRQKPSTLSTIANVRNDANLTASGEEGKNQFQKAFAQDLKQHERLQKISSTQQPLEGSKERILLSKVRRSAVDELDERILLQNRINTQQIRELNSSSATSRFEVIKQDTNSSVIESMAKTHHEKLKGKVSPRTKHESIEDANYSDIQEKSVLKQAIKDIRSSQDNVLLETQSNDTKYFSRSHKLSENLQDMNGQNMASGNLQEVLNLEIDPITKFNQNIKVVELNRGQNGYNSTDSAEETGFNSDYEGAKGDKMEKFMRMTAFIDSIFKKRDKNPVKPQSRSQAMRKHTGWSKVLMGKGVRNVANNETEILHPLTRYPSPAKIVKVDPNLKYQRKASTFRSPQVGNSHRNGEQFNKQRRTSELDANFMTANSARLHPFYHSLVNQNFELLAQQIKEEEMNFVKAAPKIDISRMKLIESQESFVLTEAHQSEMTNNFQSSFALLKAPQMFRDESVGFNLRSQLSPATQVPAQVDTSSIKRKRASINQQPMPSTKRDETDQSPRAEAQGESGEPVKVQSQNLAPKGDELIAFVLQNPSGENTASTDQTNEKDAKDAGGGSKMGSPLMNKSREQHTLSNVYRQLHASKNKKTWGVLEKPIFAGQNARNLAAAAQGMTGTGSNRQTFIQRGSIRNAIASPMRESNMNVDLMKDGATSSLREDEPSILQLRPDFAPQLTKLESRGTTLPPLKSKASVDQDSNEYLLHTNNEAESPLLSDHIFPLLSPTSADGNPINYTAAASTGFPTNRQMKKQMRNRKGRNSSKNNHQTTANSINSKKLLSQGTKGTQ